MSNIDIELDIRLYNISKNNMIRYRIWVIKLNPKIFKKYLYPIRICIIL